MSKMRPHADTGPVRLTTPDARESGVIDSELVLRSRAARAAREHLNPPVELVSAPQPAVAATSLLAEDAVARRLVEALLAAGVDTFFGIPGGPVGPLFEALRTSVGGRLVESRHETAAALSAASYYRATGNVPCVVVTAGPGITNVVTGVASACLEGIPMLVLCGDVAWAAEGGRLAQDSGPEGIHAEAMLGPVVRHVERVAHPGSAVTQVLNALRATMGPQGKAPALAICPIQHLTRPCPPIQIEQPPLQARIVPHRRAVEQTLSWLAGAERPLLVLGGGCRGHEQALRELVDVLGVPFVTTPRAKGIVSEDHPFSLRNGGMAASAWARSYTATPVDVALALGTDLDDTSVGPTPYIGRGGKLVHVDLDGRVFNRNLPTAMAIQADLGELVREAYRLVLEKGLRHPSAHLSMRHLRRTSPHDEPGFASDPRAPITPQRALSDLEQAVDPSARFITDIGEHMLFALHYLTASHPQRFHIQLNLGSMGSGISGAIGLAVGSSEPVVCICGDGGMQMNGMEAIVAKQRGLPILFAVFNDSRYNMVHHGMKTAFGQEPGFTTPDVDFAGWAQAMGIAAARVTRPGEIDAVLLEELGFGRGPVLLDIRIDREQHLRGAGRIEALQHMSMLRSSAREASK